MSQRDMNVWQDSRGNSISQNLIFRAGILSTSADFSEKESNLYFRELSFFCCVYYIISWYLKYIEYHWDISSLSEWSWALGKQVDSWSRLHKLPAQWTYYDTYSFLLSSQLHPKKSENAFMSMRTFRHRTCAFGLHFWRRGLEISTYAHVIPHSHRRGSTM